MFLRVLLEEVEALDLSKVPDPLEGVEVKDNQHVVGDMPDSVKRLLVVRIRLSNALTEASRKLKHAQIDAEHDKSLADEVQHLSAEYLVVNEEYGTVNAAFWAEVYAVMPPVLEHSNAVVLPGWQIGYEDKDDLPSSGSFFVLRG